MKLLVQLGKSALISSTVAIVSIASMTQIAVAKNPEPQLYTGTATLCAIDDPANAITETKGNVTYTYNQVLLFRIATDDPLMNGWEVLTSNTKASSGGGGYNWGEALFVPDLGTGTLVDDFKFPVMQDDNIRGTYVGTGDYEGVTVDYALGPFMPLPTECPSMPPQCIDGTYECIPVPPGLGYYINGEINPAD